MAGGASIPGALRWPAGLVAVGAALWVAVTGGAPPPLASGDGGDGPPPGLRISVLDVGQGDAVLLRPPRAPAILVDTGPADGGAGRLVRGAGVDRLGAVVLSHDESDHTGGLAELLARVPADRVLHGASLSRETRGVALGAGARTGSLARGDVLRSGALRLEALWPPRELGDGPAASDPNRRSLVLLARWGRFTALLTGDAEAEATPLAPGVVDLLKVAHHGSADAGLDDLLDRARPRIAVISVGEGNPFGHPDRATLASLAAHGVRVLRTDREGTVEITVAAPRQD